MTPSIDRRTALALLACASPAAINAQAVRNQVMPPRIENTKIRVTEIVYEPGVPRERYVRPTDQVIVFLDDCQYERQDPATGEKSVRRRKSGEVIWHDKGEDAPVLTNLGDKPYRTLLIELLTR